MPIDNTNAALLATQTAAAQAAGSAATAAQQASIGAAASSIYATKALGISGTAANAYFYVPSTSAQGSYDVWQNLAGVATATGITLPNLAAVTALQQIVSQGATLDGAAYTWMDSLTRICMQILGDGTLKAAKALILNGTINQLTAPLLNTDAVTLGSSGSALGDQYDPTYAMAVRDALTQLALGVRYDGTVDVAALNAVTATISQLTTPSVTTGTVSATLLQLAQSSLGSQLDPVYALALRDTLTRLALGVRWDGTVDLSAVNSNSLMTGTLTAGAAAVASLAATGQVSAQTGSVGFLAARTIIPGGQCPKEALADICHTIGYGQSLSVGVGAYALTSTQRFNAIMFNGGDRSLDGAAIYGNTTAQDHASFVPLTSQYVAGKTQGGETPIPGTTDMIYERVSAENTGFNISNLTLLGSSCGQGSQTVASLSKGGSYYQRIIDDVTYGYALSQAAGKTYMPLAIEWTQGETDQQNGTTAAAYIAAVQTLKANYNADIAAALGVASIDIPWVTWQNASWAQCSPNNTYPTIALALRQFTQQTPNAWCACPGYIFDYSDSLHMPNNSYKWLGAYYGLVIKRVLIDGLTWQPLEPVGYLRQGRLATITFNVPAGGLVWDTTQVTNPGNYGFSLVDASGNALSMTTPPAITGGNTVRITADATIPAGAKLRYGFIGDQGYKPGRLYGNRGCLRDQQGDYIVFDTPELNARMDNWCLVFELTLS